MLLENEKVVDQLLKDFGSVKVVKNWNWKKKFDDPDQAIKFLLQQLKMSRKITYHTLLYHKQSFHKEKNLSIN